MRLRLCLLITFTLIAQNVARSQPGQENWTLTTADFKNEAVVLKSIDGNALQVAPPGGGDARAVPLPEFLQIERALPSATGGGKFVLHMTGGDRLGGEPTGVKGEQLVWKNASLGEVTIPMRRLVAITRPDKTPGDEKRREDVVTLANGDTVRGIITNITPDKITVQTTDGGNSDVPFGAVALVGFAATPGAVGDAPGYRVRLDDNSSLVGFALKLSNNTLELTLDKNATRTLKLDHVAAIEQVNGPVSWLSSRTPSESIYTPFFGSEQSWPARMDRTVEGREIVFKDQKFPRGIGVHAYSRLSWPLDGKYESFRTRYAIDGDRELADVTVRIKLDDKTVYEKANVRAGALSPVILLDLNGAKKLTLEVDFGQTGDVQDRLNWIESALLRKKPT